MPIAKANFSHKTDFENEGVDVAYFTVDFISAMNAETGDPDTASAVAGLELTRRTIEQFINILGEGPLVDSNTQKTYMVRADALGTLISGNTLRDAIRALNGNGQVTATISSATVTLTKMGILTAAAVS
jgi:hypothetical protein|tara:strand:+ start:4802 stop:5188 length:387 start_codon:yes stop_codon:yes gene_type:complete